MAGTVYLDGECHGLLDLTSVGSSKYWAHPSSNITVACWSVDGGPVQSWCPDGNYAVPIDIEWASRLVAFGDFERLWLRKYGVNVEDKYDDLQARALYAGLPANLHDLLGAMRSPFKKDMKGNALSVRMAKPRKLEPLTWWHLTDPEKLIQLEQYCKTDVAPMQWLDERLPRLPEAEYRSYRLDRHANELGVPVDVSSIRSAIEVLEIAKERVDDQFIELIGDTVPTPRSAVKLRQWFEDRGHMLSGVGAEEIDALAESGEVKDPLVKKIIELRQASARSSTSKLVRMLDMVQEDGRIRGTIRWHGAHTGRKSSLGVQFQNFPRAVNLEEGLFSVLALPLSPSDRLRVLEMMYGAANEVVANSMRGFIKASPGKVLVGCDLSQIEAAVLAWLACEDEILADISNIYQNMAASIFGCTPEETKTRMMGPVNLRFLGKIGVLACGYGGGPVAFESMAAQFGVKGLTPEIIDAAVEGFRKARPNTCKLWRRFEGAALDAVKNPGTLRPLWLRENTMVGFGSTGKFLECTLPSKRVLRYAYPRIGKSRKFGTDCLTYEGYRSQTKAWSTLDVWGGTLVENVVQAIAGDIMMLGSDRLFARGLPVILTVHDECIVETTPDRISEVGPIFTLKTEPVPSWLSDLPLSGKVWSAERYLKE